MDELTPNPDDCKRFEPNQFKKEKCKNCGRPWQQHLGVITQAQVDAYVSVRQKEEQDKKDKEAAAKAKLKAKAVAKKKAAQAVEDNWLFDGSQAAEAEKDDDSEDDDLGFRMFSAGEFGAAPVESRQARNSEIGKPLKVKNLIDFGECDVPDEDEPPPNQSMSAPPMEAAPSSFGGSGPRDSPTAGPSSLPSSSSLPSGGLYPPQSMTEAPPHDIVEDLLGQVEHLRCQLADANEERSIQVAIVRDEVAEKQLIIEDLKRRRTEDEARTAAAEAAAEAQAQRIADLESSGASASSAPTAELEQLRAANEAHVQRIAELESSSREVPSQASTAELEQLRTSNAELAQQMRDAAAEIERLRAGATAPPAPSTEESQEVERLRAEVQEIRHSSAQQDLLVQELRRCNAQLEEALKAAQAQAAQAQAPPPAAQEVAAVWSTATVALISELHGVSAQTRQLLAEDAASVGPSAVEVDRDPEAALKQLLEASLAARAAAERSSEERRRLEAKVSEAQAAAAAAITISASAAAAALPPSPARPAPAAQAPPTSASAAPSTASAGESAAAPASASPASPEGPLASPEAQAAAQAVGRQAAQALREVRQNAERQLAWLTKRIKQSEFGAAPLVDRGGGGD